ncbi:hypothetical protein BJ170DRAFT_617418 [Xylariales sp. AK1849]|nr:hypothetical protein BJ170DRAFT_617418 [Xylariales sp. AK1849]
MRTILTQVIPKLKKASPVFSATSEGVAKLESLLGKLLELHVTLTKLSESLQDLERPSRESQSLQHTIAKLPNLLDYSIIDLQAHAQAVDLLESLLQAVPGGEDKPTMEGQLKALNGTLSLALNKKDPDTPFSILVNNIFSTFRIAEANTKGKTLTMVLPPNALSMKPVTFSINGADDLAARVPLVHPDQCQMEMRIADAAYFADDFATATAHYTSLRERLSFVPLLQKDAREVSSGKTPTSLLSAFQKLERVDRLSHWTLDSLASLYTQVCGRLEQLSMQRDLFGLSPDWAPRLSTQYYLDYAQQQLQRLRILEGSYWKYFESYQDQMEIGVVLKEVLAANVYRRKEARDTLAAVLRLMRDKETAIETAAKDIEAKRVKLVEDLSKVQDALKRLQVPSAASFLSAISACVVTGLALASNPVGWVAGIGLAAVALSPQGLSLIDEATNSIDDSHGQKVNKNFVIKKINKCGDDLKSLLGHPAYSMQADGTKTVNSEDSAKIAVTEEQLRSFLQQFQDTIGPKQQHLRKSLDDSLKAFTKATNGRNQDILAYSNAVIQAYELMKQQALFEKQAGDISFQLMKESIGLPSIVAYYQRFREVSRISILSSIKHSALALRFWGLGDAVKFTVGLMSPLDELEAHIDVLLKEHGTVLANIGSFPQSSWPASTEKLGILYKLSKAELDALKLGPTDSFGQSPAKPPFRMYTVAINSLTRPATSRSSLHESPFAGLANVRISQVRVWLPGLQVSQLEPGLEAKSTLIIDIKQEGAESFASPHNKLLNFRHSPVYMSFQYDWKAVKAVKDIHTNHVTASHSLPSDWLGSNINARVQSPIGPFATWVITIRERDNGPLDLSNVKAAYIEFHGSGIAFSR